MGKWYKLVELTEAETKDKKINEISNIACSKCVAYNDCDLCDSLPSCYKYSSYFIEVETDDK